MSYLKKLLAEDERPIYKTYMHWVFAIKGVVWFIVLSAVGFFINYFVGEVFGHYTPINVLNISKYTFVNPIVLFKWFCVAGGGIMFFVYFLKYYSTEILLTNQRILYKTGLIFVKAEELELEEIREEEVNHGWLGYLFNYGSVRLECRWVDDLNLETIKKPNSFMKALFKARRDVHEHDIK